MTTRADERVRGVAGGVRAGRVRDPELRASLAWLTHPVTVVALVVLLLNDHVLKRAYGTWWTGKLSDVAGLVLAPALLAVAISGVRAWARRPGSSPGARGSVRHPRRTGAVRPRPRAPFGGLTTIVVGLGFTFVKATAVGATLASAAWTAVAGPSEVLRDTTDLLALPALAVAWWAARVSSRPSRVRAGRRWALVLPLAVLATAATSSMGPTGTLTVDVEDGAVLVGTGWSETDVRLHRSTDGVTWTSVEPTYPPGPGPSEAAGADPTSPAVEDGRH
ncbi:hypothetical protein [Cellulomonas persica]|uniref:Uncharacterized protein n=1 Tax=Cellulomonas persica TaxID=76861 RepID=A0A510UVN2_9CELL|nr:hypothetical protein [Cellulomonas persica]GEK17541.1 hypothetical protein CPE01_12740 [Cellulomonas persica]